MTATTATLFTLPPHLRESIAALVAADIAPANIQADLKTALAAADVEEFEEEYDENGDEEGEGKPNEKKEERKIVMRSTKEEGKEEKSETGASESIPSPRAPRRKPPTINGDVLDAVATWAGSARESLTSSGLDPADYSFIGLLAGTEVYLPPRQRALAAAADKALADKEKANPFIPTYMSPTPPSLGSEYRQLTRDLATVLNILFSVFGVGGGVYVVAKNAGWTRETAMLLAIVAGIVVGIADSVLVWIFKVRLKKDRKDTAKRRVRMNKGSAAIPGTAKVLTLDDEEGDGEVEGSEVALEVAEQPVASATEKRTLRLRRKPLGE